MSHAKFVSKLIRSVVKDCTETASPGDEAVRMLDRYLTTENTRDIVYGELMERCDPSTLSAHGVFLQSMYMIKSKLGKFPPSKLCAEKLHEHANQLLKGLPTSAPDARQACMYIIAVTSKRTAGELPSVSSNAALSSASSSLSSSATASNVSTLSANSSTSLLGGTSSTSSSSSSSTSVSMSSSSASASSSSSTSGASGNASNLSIVTPSSSSGPQYSASAAAISGLSTSPVSSAIASLAQSARRARARADMTSTTSSTSSNTASTSSFSSFSSSSDVDPLDTVSSSATTNFQATPGSHRRILSNLCALRLRSVTNAKAMSAENQTHDVTILDMPVFGGLHKPSRHPSSKLSSFVTPSIVQQTLEIVQQEQDQSAVSTTAQSSFSAPSSAPSAATANASAASTDSKPKVELFGYKYYVAQSPLTMPKAEMNLVFDSLLRPDLPDDLLSQVMRVVLKMLCDLYAKASPDQWTHVLHYLYEFIEPRRPMQVRLRVFDLVLNLSMHCLILRGGPARILDSAFMSRDRRDGRTEANAAQPTVASTDDDNAGLTVLEMVQEDLFLKLLCLMQRLALANDREPAIWTAASRALLYFLRDGSSSISSTVSFNISRLECVDVRCLAACLEYGTDKLVDSQIERLLVRLLVHLLYPESTLSKARLASIGGPFFLARMFLACASQEASENLFAALVDALTSHSAALIHVLCGVHAHHALRMLLRTYPRGFAEDFVKFVFLDRERAYLVDKKATVKFLYDLERVAMDLTCPLQGLAFEKLLEKAVEDYRAEVTLASVLQAKPNVLSLVQQQLCQSGSSAAHTRSRMCYLRIVDRLLIARRLSTPVSDPSEASFLAKHYNELMLPILVGHNEQDPACLRLACEIMLRLFSVPNVGVGLGLENEDTFDCVNVSFVRDDVASMILHGRLRLLETLLREVDSLILLSLYRNVGAHPTLIQYHRLLFVLLIENSSSDICAAVKMFGGHEWLEQIVREDRDPLLLVYASKFLLDFYKKARPEYYKTRFATVLSVAQMKNDVRILQNPYLTMKAFLDG